MYKKIIAREWIYLLISLVIGLTIVPIIIFLFLPNDKLSDFYSALIGGGNYYVVWSIAFSPYILFLFLRSIFWALKTLKNE